MFFRRKGRSLLSSRLVTLFLALTLLLLILPVSSVSAGSFITRSYSGRSYKVYIPDGYSSDTPVPMVVVLHGCTQDPDQIAQATQMNSYAESQTFIAVYPQQTSAANLNQCWNWFEPSHQSRGSGEPALIAGMANAVMDDYNIDSDRVYVTGISAGGAMTVIMGATYPDLFAAIGVAAGLEYKAATSVLAGFTAMSSGGPNPDTQGQVAYNEMGSYARVVPVIVFHGTSDSTVAPINADQIISQWAQTDDLALDGVDNDDIEDGVDQTINGSVPGGRSYTRYVYNGHNGQSLLEKYMVDGMGHAWSGGAAGASYTDPDGPNSTEIILDFFAAHPKSGVDTMPPVTTADPAGGTYQGSVTVSLSTNEPATTYYTLDGSTPTTGSPQYTAPLEINTTSTLRFFSVDSAGNQEAVQTENYTIEEPEPDTTPPVTTADPAGGSYQDSVTVSLSTNEPATTYYTVDGSTPTTGSPQYSAPIEITSDTTLQFFSVDTAGNSEAVQSEVYTITTPTGNEMTFSSIGSEDGFDGATIYDGYGSSTQKMGDKGFLTLGTYRGFLSFDTSDLPDGATITGATLRIYRKSMSGTVNYLKADIKNGVFGSSSNIEVADYYATASAIDVVTLDVPAGDDQSSEAALSANGLQNINKSGRTQFKLKAYTGMDYVSDVLYLYGGEDGSLAPVLIVTYTE